MTAPTGYAPNDPCVNCKGYGFNWKLRDVLEMDEDELRARPDLLGSRTPAP